MSTFSVQFDWVAFFFSRFILDSFLLDKQKGIPAPLKCWYRSLCRSRSWCGIAMSKCTKSFVGGLGLATGAVPSPFLEFVFIFLTFRATRLQSLRVKSLLVSVRSWGGSLATSAGREEKKTNKWEASGSGDGIQDGEWKVMGGLEAGCAFYK